MSRFTTLVADDEENDRFLLRRAVARSGLDWSLMEVQDGQKAEDYLSGKGPYEDRTKFPMPQLVLLDLNMPFINGFDVLEWLRTQPLLKGIPVVVLTSSPLPSDRQKAMTLGATDYQVKPNNGEELVSLLRGLPARVIGNG